MKKISIYLIIICLILTGCGKSTSKSKKEDFKGEKTIETSINEYSDYGYVDVTYGENFTHYTVIVDKDYNVKSKYLYNATLVDLYVLKESKDEENKINVYDVDGNVAFSYDKFEYTDVELIPNGYLIMSKEEETYNSSSKKSGIYNIKDKKWAVELSEKYYNQIRLKGSYMVVLKDDKEFFNTKIGKVVSFSEKIPYEFIDGFAVYTEQNKITYYSDDGKKNSMSMPDYAYGGDNKYNHNGFFVYVENSNDGPNKHFLIYNLKNNTKLDLAGKFYSIIGVPKFTKDGYALVYFNNQGGTPFYTVIDSTGKMMFEPVRVSDSDPKYNDLESKELLNNNLIHLVNSNGEELLMDYNNKLVYQGEKYEYIKGITNNLIMIRNETPGKAQTSYFKDLNGKKINIKLSSNIKIIE